MMGCVSAYLQPRSARLRGKLYFYGFNKQCETLALQGDDTQGCLISLAKPYSLMIFSRADTQVCVGAVHRCVSRV